MTTRSPGSLYAQVLVAIALGVLLGWAVPETGESLRPLGEGFVKLVRMLIAPLVFCTVVTGIAGMESMKAVGRTGALALLYFEAVTTAALVLGLVVVNVVQPGVGVVHGPLDEKAVAAYTGPGKMQGVVDVLLGIIPPTLGHAFAEGEVLQVLFVALLFGFALHGAGERARPVLGVVDAFSAVLFRMIAMVMKLAPIGAFGAMAFTIGKYGLGSLVALGKLMACFYGTCLAFVFGVLGLVAYAHGFSIVRFVRYIAEELFVVLGTSSSESALPRLMTKLEDLGCHRTVVGLVVPAGYSFNLDGTSIYLTMAAVFVAQATNTPLDLGQQAWLLGVLLLTSKGAAGVTGSGFIVLAASLGAVGHVPVAGLSLILGIDRFMSEARALTNLVGNGVATIVVARWCGALDEARLAEGLREGPRRPEAERAA